MGRTDEEKFHRLHVLPPVCPPNATTSNMKLRRILPPPPAGPREDYQPSQESDHFNYRWRWTNETSVYELYSPWSGETISFDDGSNPDDLSLINRAYSLWREPGDWTVPATTPAKSPIVQQTSYYDASTYLNDDNGSVISGYAGVDDGVTYVMIQTQPYMSRIWGVRSFLGCNEMEESTAATLLAAVCRGFLARRTLRRWFHCYYRRCLDAATGFYYFRMFNDEDNGNDPIGYDYDYNLPPSSIEVMATITTSDASHETAGRGEGKEASTSAKLRFEDEKAATGPRSEGNTEGVEGEETRGEKEERKEEGEGDEGVEDEGGEGMDYAGAEYEGEGATFSDPTTSWYKPRLARIEDILVKDLTPVLDVAPADVSWAVANTTSSQGHDDGKLTTKGFKNGPFFRVAGRGKSEKCRSEEAMAVFLDANNRRLDAVSRHESIDLETTPLGSLIVWMDGLIDVDYLIDDYAYMRATVSGNTKKEAGRDSDNRRWGRILRSTKAYPDRILTQMYGLFALAKTQVPVASDGILDYAAADALEFCVEAAHYHNPDTIYAVKAFAMHSLANILDTAGGRTEFLGVSKVVARDGEDRGMAVRKHLVKRFDTFCVFLRNIQLEKMPEAGSDRKHNEDEEPVLPSRRGTELTELSLKCLAFLAREEANRELMASVVAEDVIRSMVVCSEEGYVVYWGCRLLYNICYRSEAGADVLLSRSTLLKVIEVSEYNHGGDPDVLRQIVRLKMAVEPSGWRGSVEEDIEKMMRRQGLGRQLTKQELVAPPKHKRRVRSRGKNSLSAKGNKDEEDGDDDGDEAQIEDKEFRNSDIVASYAFAYGNETTVAAAKEIKRFEKLMKFSPKYRKIDEGKGGDEGKDEKPSDNDVAQKEAKAKAIADVEAGLHKLDSKDGD